MKLRHFTSAVRMFGLTTYCDHIHRTDEADETLCHAHEFNVRLHLWNHVFMLVIHCEREPHRHAEIPLEMYR